MKIASRIAEKILRHCSKCGGCPIGKIIGAQAEAKDNASSQTQLEKKSKIHV